MFSSLSLLQTGADAKLLQCFEVSLHVFDAVASFDRPDRSVAPFDVSITPGASLLAPRRE